ncbi:hypothetical protein [Methylocystis sp. ATCC 49242]|uniref:hypothetical protein n=1 Tax=Methylocystis sp. ATCC 49242 TaxID=622637 RepID=UPI0001F86D43|nr:hypothetical protein [Methylocystis sp. ATCC 49242]
MRRFNPDWGFVLHVTRPAVLLAPRSYLDEIAAGLREAGVQDAVKQRDSEPIFDWLTRLISLQGITDAVAFGFDARHGGVRFADVERALRHVPICPRLRCYWAFDSCGYRKGAGTCAEPGLLPFCPLPKHRLRKGALNVAAYSLFLFIRDVCDGDFVGWIDERLAAADPGVGVSGRAVLMQASLLDPLRHIDGVGPKLWNMMLADLLLAGDPERERWMTTGANMIAIDTLVHNFLHRTGVLRRFNAEHAYGPGCYAPNGCAEIIMSLAQRIDAREFNPANPAVFPRFVQHALWGFCAAWGWNICNGNRIVDRRRCENTHCPSFADCDRVPLKDARD